MARRISDTGDNGPLLRSLALPAAAAATAAAPGLLFRSPVTGGAQGPGRAALFSPMPMSPPPRLGASGPAASSSAWAPAGGDGAAAAAAAAAAGAAGRDLMLVQSGRPLESMDAYLAQVGIGMALGILLEGTGMLDHDAIGVGSEPDAPYRQVHLNQLRRRVSALVGQLPPPQQRVLREHYVHDRPFEEVARCLGVSRGRISQIHRQALDALHQALAHHEPCDLSC